MDQNSLKSLENLNQDLTDAAIDERLKLTYEQRIEAHENARQLLNDLQNAGKQAYAESKTSSRKTLKK